MGRIPSARGGVEPCYGALCKGMVKFNYTTILTYGAMVAPARVGCYAITHSPLLTVTHRHSPLLTVTHRYSLITRLMHARAHSHTRRYTATTTRASATPEACIMGTRSTASRAAHVLPAHCPVVPTQTLVLLPAMVVLVVLMLVLALTLALVLRTLCSWQGSRPCSTGLNDG